MTRSEGEIAPVLPSDQALVRRAFERQGDEEMAEFLAREATERMHYLDLATWWPELQQWLDGRLGPRQPSDSPGEPPGVTV